MKTVTALSHMKIAARHGLSRLVQAFRYPSHQPGVRCLSYHSIVEVSKNEPEQMTTPVGLFRKQMSFLAANGYLVEEAAKVIKRLSAGEPLEPKTVILTFDDGFANNYHLALPILIEHRFPATVFLMTAALDGKPERLHNTWVEEYLMWEQVREMQESSLICFGCHSATHRNLRGLRENELSEETEGAKHRLEDGLGRAVDLFAYPFGSYGSWDERVREAVERAGFLGAFTTIFGYNTVSIDRFLLKRSRVSWCDDIPEFDRLLQGSYDWYAFIQRLQARSARRVGTAQLSNSLGCT